MWEGKVHSHEVCSTFYRYTSFIQCLKLSQKSCRSSCLESEAWDMSVFTIIIPKNQCHFSSLLTPTHLISFSFLSSSACARYHLPSLCCTICGPPSVPYVLSCAIRPYVHSRAIHPAAVPYVLHLPSIIFHPSSSLSRTIPAATGAICPVSTPSVGCIVPLPIRSTAEGNLTLSELNIIKPKLNTPLKLAKIDIETKTDGKSAEYFEKMTKDQNFDIFWGPKWHKTSKSTCNEHVKQYWCETSENFLRI